VSYGHVTRAVHKPRLLHLGFHRVMAIVWTMPRRSILSSAARDSLFVLPDTQDEIIRYYTLTESDLAITNQHRGGANRLGFAVQLWLHGLDLAKGDFSAK
jgi:Domain of unknown function (DUF4158)